MTSDGLLVIYTRFLETPAPGTPSYQFHVYMVIIGHVVAAPGPLACPSRGARPRNCLNLT